MAQDNHDNKLSVGTASSSVKTGEAVKRRAPTLYAIIIFKLLKGALFLSAAIAVYCLSNDDLPAQYRSLLHFLRVQPDTQFWSYLAVKVGHITAGGMLRVAWGLFIYSLFSLVEGVGLTFRVPWAGWLAIGESLFFIALELDSLSRKHSWVVGVVLVINIVIVWYLVQNRHRLFRHHHH